MQQYLEIFQGKFKEPEPKNATSVVQKQLKIAGNCAKLSDVCDLDLSEHSQMFEIGKKHQKVECPSTEF